MAVEFLAPANWEGALEARAAHPQATVVAGGTDVMVALNFGRIRPSVLLDLSEVLAPTGARAAGGPGPAGDPDPAVGDVGPAVGEVTGWRLADGGRTVWLGAGLTWSRVYDEVAPWLPGLALAARTVGSPQVRHRATVVGNLGSASPAGDAHPALLAGDAVVVAESLRGIRAIPVGEFFTGPKRHVLAPDELIRGISVPAADGPEQFAKVGTRNAMVIAVVSFALSLHPGRRTIGTGIGSAGPTPLPATAAGTWLAGELTARDAWASPEPLPREVVDHFGELVAGAARPIDDLRGRADYRRHALAVLARRTLTWAWAGRDRQAEAA